jgi:hypothetical protein
MDTDGEDEGLRTTYGPAGGASPESEPEAEPPPEPMAEPVAGRDRQVAGGLAVALLVLFFTPWFNARPFLHASGAGMVSWTSRYLDDLPRRDFDVSMLVPYLALLIPLGAVACLALLASGRRARGVAIATGLVAPVLFVYLLVRAGTSTFKVLDAGAYLTLVCSLALYLVAAGVRPAARARPALAVGLTALVVACFAVPAGATERVDSALFTAYANNRTTLAPARAAAPVTTTTTMATTTTSVETTTTVAAPVAVASTTTTSTSTTTTTAKPRCPSNGPTSTITLFHYDQTAPDSQRYSVDVRGTLENRTGAAIDLTTIEVGVFLNGSEVGHISIAANRTLETNTALEFGTDDAIVDSPGGPPSDAQVTAVPYTWHDGRLAACAKP